MQYKIKLLTFFLSSLLVACNEESSDTAKEEISTPIPFTFEEGTIEQMRSSLKSGGATCKSIVQGYLNRINAYDKQGPALNSIITINPNAMNEAAALDAYYQSTGNFKGPLHCVTVLPKDNIDTNDMPTSAGSLALMESQPDTNAYIIQNIKNAGGIIIGKANLDEFAFGFQGNGTHPRGGQVKNAYDLTKGPGGSSSGTGTAIAASFAMVGIGTDTGGSIRVPSSVEGLYGLRPSLRLVSQSGIIPLAPFQDTAGPVCRAVEDCALLMDSLIGFDPNSFSNQRTKINIDAPLISNSTEYQSLVNNPKSYLEFMNKDALKGARIGVVRDLFGSNSDEVEIVNNQLNNAIEKMKAAGAIVEDVKIDDLNTILTKYSSMSAFQFKSSLTGYLKSWSNSRDNHYLSYDEILSSGLARSNFNIYNIDLTTPPMQEHYILNTVERPDFVRTRINNALDNKNLDGTSKGKSYDVLLYPTIQGLPSALGESPTTGTNNRLSPFSGFPAMNIPAGMVFPKNSAISVPVGIELIGREFDERTIFKIAYAWEQYAHPRQAPKNTPELN